MKYNKIAMLVATSSLILSGCGIQEDTTLEAKENHPKVVKVFELGELNTFIEKLEYPAEIYANQDSSMAFEVSGKITSFHFKEGQKLKKGDIIAELDDTIYQANYDSALANYKQAKIDYDRYKKLLKTKAIAQIQVEQQEQTVKITKAALDIATKNLEETKLRAEFDGVVAKKLVNDFERVTAKQPIIKLQDNSNYKIKFYIPENDLLKLNKEITPENLSSTKDFFVKVGVDTYSANLVDISTTAEKTTRTFETTVKISNNDVNILPGMTAKVFSKNKKEKQNNILIPYKSVFSDLNNNSLVWVIDKDNTVSSKEIELGSLSNDSIEVLSGLDLNDKIAMSGVHHLSENDQIVEYKKLGN